MITFYVHLCNFLDSDQCEVFNLIHFRIICVFISVLKSPIVKKVLLMFYMYSFSDSKFNIVDFVLYFRELLLQ